ncbi:MAG: SusD/RagB family nutrient-binding outer membrane lipoprotein [Cyclobacteriaceae bacterium]|nr:SusD/RagB family nutrient-binding outer membrane lipoprotein [Cyclobacteriaceae bacterium]
MKTIKKIGFVLSLIFLLSCEDYLDINSDPNNPTDATPDLILPAAQLSVASVIGGDYAIMGNMWCQYWTQNHTSNQYKEYDGFNLQPDFIEVRFQELYAGALNDLKKVKQKSSQSEDWGFYLIATAMEAYTFQILADIYGEIPFTEANKGELGIFSPHYEGGQLVYDSLLARLNNALAKDLSAPTVTDPGNSDFIFGGDLDKWVQFVNTLKLKMYLRQVNVNAGAAKAGIDALYSGNADFLDTDAAVTGFQDEANASNPLYEQDRRQLNTPKNIRASTTFVSFLQNNGDPRIDMLYEIPEAGGPVTGMRQGDYELSSLDLDAATISLATINATDPVHFFTYAESLFLQAEAAARGYGTGNAKNLYDQATLASFAYYGLDGSSFIAPGGAYAYPDGSEAVNIEAIIMQKWAAQARVNGLEAWFDHLRTGFPLENTSPSTFVPNQLNYPVNGLTSGKFPRRLLYPDREVSRNANVPAQKDIFTPVWWDN